MEIKKDNICLFVVWKNARHKEKEILGLIGERFSILKKYFITWTPEKFRHNLSSFYVDDFTMDCFQETHRGNGEFIAVIAHDDNPAYAEMQTNKGKHTVNMNCYNLKHEIREQMLSGFQFHATDTAFEAGRDICLLTGKSIADLIETKCLDGTAESLHRNLPCVDGFQSIEHVFYILNETVPYVVLRNYALLPDNFQVDEHGDIDIFVSDLQNFVAVLKERNGLRKNAFPQGVVVSINGENVFFHTKFVNDNYMDARFEQAVLNTRKKNKNNIFIPSDEMYFWSLLYHALIHKKCISHTYFPILEGLAKKLCIPYLNNIKTHRSLLNDFMEEHQYKFTQVYENIPLKIDTLVGAGNILNKNLIQKEREYLVYSTPIGAAILDKELVFTHPTLATALIRFGHMFINFSEHVWTKDKIPMKYARKYVRKRTKFLCFRCRFGNILMSEGAMPLCSRRLSISKKFLLGNVKKIETRFLVVGREKKRHFIDGITFLERMRDTVNTKEDKMAYLELFIGMLFHDFQQNGTNMLKPKAFDMLPSNCLLLHDHHYEWFDFEYEMIGGMDRSYMIYRILKYYNISETPYEDYQYLCTKFKVEEKWHWCEYMESMIFQNLYSDRASYKQSALRSFLIKLTVKIIPKRYRNPYLKEILENYFSGTQLFKKIFKLS